DRYAQDSGNYCAQLLFTPQALRTGHQADVLRELHERAGCSAEQSRAWASVTVPPHGGEWDSGQVIWYLDHLPGNVLEGWRSARDHSICAMTHRSSRPAGVAIV